MSRTMYEKWLNNAYGKRQWPQPLFDLVECNERTIFTIKFMPSAHLGSYGLASSLPDNGLWYPVVKEIHGDHDIHITVYHDPKPSEAWAMQVAIALCQARAMGAQVTTNAFVTQYTIEQEEAD